MDGRYIIIIIYGIRNETMLLRYAGETIHTNTQAAPLAIGIYIFINLDIFFL